MVTRKLHALLKNQKKSVLLLGPRQVGKSTLLKALKPDLVINLAREREFLDHTVHPELLEELIRGANAQLVMVDEVQRIPSILNTIQAVIDESKIKFLISGSSARKLKRGQANLLPGRLVSYTMGGLSGLELEGNLNLKRSLIYGFLPEVFLEKNTSQAADILSTYAGVYLKEEIQAELLVRNIQGFSRFLASFSEYSGKILDLSKVSSKAKVSRTGAFRFLEILEETLLIIRCESFQEASEADTVSHPRYYFFDPGVLNGLLGGFSLSKDRTGLLFEHAVIAQIQNTASASHTPIELFYFRTRNGLEVDFLLRTKGKLWAIEAKYGQVAPEDSKSLEAFRKYFPAVDELVVVVPEGLPRKLRSGVRILSLSGLLEKLFV
ncbi:MAG: AAA family ATPase [Bdellovibrionia bacterium]